MRKRRGAVSEKGETGMGETERRSWQKKRVEEETQRDRQQQMEQLKRIVKFNS